jgi:ElaB/YqjD/DUF883 family membrane-anchored ribosome-binding protein
MRHELDALRRELQRAPRIAEEPDVAAAGQPVQGAAAGDPADTGAYAEVTRILEDLQARLSEVADEAEDLVTAHPAASIATAFLLGLAVGSLLMRTK